MKKYYCASCRITFEVRAARGNSLGYEFCGHERASGRVCGQRMWSGNAGTDKNHYATVGIHPDDLPRHAREQAA